MQTTITANDIRVLARSGDEDPVLALVDGQPVVLPAAELADHDHVVCTQVALVQALGLEITDAEAEIFAGRLTADLPE
ncbi:MAG: hypothetical protein HOU81_26255 [Hamadaea sp.]|uniref:hypothetical protein n=1 Tax=Hamadaea sp. TaxID=2024425 RepID=UPI00180A23AB|nr:hypothetical protein [Hamadaea sp.]NUR74328.1 hypothetical protein [Hamadaea sp.]NUT24056.1 hypothetical protein [Hamadaea sp.]